MEKKQQKENWIIFYDVDGVRWYFVKIYKIGRVRFSRSQFAVFDNVLDVGEQLKLLEEPLKLYPIPSKLKIAQANITIS